MALTTCRDCKAVTATSAKKCQACGSKNPGFRFWHIPLAIGVLFLISKFL